MVSVSSDEFTEIEDVHHLHFVRNFQILHEMEILFLCVVEVLDFTLIIFHRFLVRGRVDSHKRAVHGIGTAELQLCSYCGRTFSSGYNMDYHLAKEHGIGKVKKVGNMNASRNDFSLYFGTFEFYISLLQLKILIPAHLICNSQILTPCCGWGFMVSS